MNPTPKKLDPLWYGVSFALVVLGLKLWIIAGFGSPVPYWDQWDAEADRLYRPFIEGSLRFADLFAPHNEHRIVTTRLLGLGLLQFNKGVWDPVLEMYVNAFLHVGALALLLLLLQRGLSVSMKPLLFGFATLLFAVPFGHENLLAGFQSQFYLLMLFSFLLLWAAFRLEQAPVRWSTVIASASVLSFFSMASGALSIAAAAGLLFVRWFVGVGKRPLSVLVIALLCVGFVSAVLFTPSIPAHAALKAHSFWQFLLAFFLATGAGILYLPVWLFMVRQLKRRPPADEHSWFVFGVCLWVLGQVLAIAYGRWHGIFSSRYLDLFSIGLLLNFYCLAQLLQVDGQSTRVRKGIGMWLLLVMTLLGVFVPKMVRRIDDKRAVMLENRENVCGYLMTGEEAYLRKKPYDEIPYPDAERLKSLLDNPDIAGILVPEVDGRNTNTGYGFYTRSSRKTMAVVGSIMFFYGIGLLFYGNVKSSINRDEKET